MTRTTAIPTHYLHHQYFREEAGAWLLVWRRRDSDGGPEDFRATAEGDRCTYAAKARPMVGRQTTRRFSK